MVTCVGACMGKKCANVFGNKRCVILSYHTDYNPHYKLVTVFSFISKIKYIHTDRVIRSDK